MASELWKDRRGRRCLTIVDTVEAPIAAAASDENNSAVVAAAFASFADQSPSASSEAARRGQARTCCKPLQHRTDDVSHRVLDRYFASLHSRYPPDRPRNSRY